MQRNFFSDPIITRQSPLILLFKFIFFALFFNILFVLTSVGYVYARQYLTRPIVTEPTVFLILFMIEIMIFVMLIIVWFNEYVVVDEHFILHKKGIFFTKEARHKLDTINNLSIEQNLISKVLRYGDVIISHSNDEITLLHHIPYPNQLVYLIEQKIEVVQEKNSKQEMFKK